MEGYAASMTSLAGAVDAAAAEHGFAGVVSVDRGGTVEFARAYGMAHRAHQIPNTVDTRFATASASKTMTALVVISLIEQGVLSLSTTTRSLLGDDLPLIDDAVTIEQLLTHRSGIGDYLDEEGEDYDAAEYVLTAPVHQYTTTERFLIDLDGHPTKFPPGERFSYCNGGYVVLALIAERASRTSFHDLVRNRVCTPAGLTRTDFLRSDELPEDTAHGYLDPTGNRTNIFHLPILGNGDGGIYTTAADVGTFWRALLAGKIVPTGWVQRMLEPHSNAPEEGMRYGLGLWLHETSRAAIMLGGDVGVSFRSVHDPDTDLTHTVISNTMNGAWPITKRLEQVLGG
jgi:CubicO group peptidase (beta-lactamase class C family)